MLWLAVAIGGAIGSLARHAANVVVHRLVGEVVPFATATVNIVGALAGLVASGHLRIGETGRAFVFVGILGGFTTFSSSGLDTFALVRSGAMMVALSNVVAQVVIGLACVLVGYRVAALL